MNDAYRFLRALYKLIRNHGSLFVAAISPVLSTSVHL